MSKHNIDKYGISRAHLNTDDFDEFDDMIDETRASLGSKSRMDDGTKSRTHGSAKMNKPIRIQKEYE